MTLAQISILTETDNALQRKAEEPQAQPATTMDVMMLSRAAARASGG